MPGRNPLRRGGKGVCVNRVPAGKFRQAEGRKEDVDARWGKVSHRKKEKGQLKKSTLAKKRSIGF